MEDNNKLNKEKDGLRRKVALSVSQALFSRRDVWHHNLLKGIVRIGVNAFYKKYDFMKDEIIDADISFDADELDDYQFPNKNTSLDETPEN